MIKKSILFLSSRESSKTRVASFFLFQDSHKSATSLYYLCFQKTWDQTKLCDFPKKLTSRPWARVVAHIALDGKMEKKHECKDSIDKVIE